LQEMAVEVVELAVVAPVAVAAAELVKLLVT
jgi:hypothetical protein